MFAFLSYKLGAILVRILPDGVSRAIASILATIQYLLRTGLRRVATANLRSIPDLEGREARAAALRLFKNFAESIRLFLRMPYLEPRDLASLVKPDKIRDALAKLEPGRGFIIVTAHLGPWELAGAYLASLGLRVNTVALDHPSSKVTEFFNQRRRAVGVQSYPLKGSFSPLCRALARGECVVLLVDREYAGGKKRYRFLGAERRLPESHLLMAARMKVPVFVGGFFFSEDGGFDYEVKGPYNLPTNRSRDEAMRDLQERCLRDLEQIVRSHADQWFCFTPIDRRE